MKKGLVIVALVFAVMAMTALMPSSAPAYYGGCGYGWYGGYYPAYYGSWGYPSYGWGYYSGGRRGLFGGGLFGAGYGGRGWYGGCCY